MDGTSGPDTLNGSISAETLNGLDGNDSLFGGGGNDLLQGGPGDDTLDGGSGSDTLKGGGGADTYVQRGSSVIIDSGGIDTVRSWGDYVLPSAIENVRLMGTTAAYSSIGNNAGNVMTGNDAGNHLYGQAGDDTLNGMGGNDILAGGADRDTLDGGAGADSMTGGRGNDTYYVDDPGDAIVEVAGEGSDTVDTLITFTLTDALEKLVLLGGSARSINGTGNDFDNRITGNPGGNTLAGNGGDDSLTGLGGNDALNGGDGTDTLTGGGGNDNLDGGAGADRLLGGDGDDKLRGIDTGDTLTGGAGRDNFYFLRDAGDIITDFQSGVDRFTFDMKFGQGDFSYYHTSFIGGFGAYDSIDPFYNHHIDDSELVSGSGVTSAPEGNTGVRFLYDTSTGALYYDGDGAAAGTSPMLVAMLTGAPTLTAHDITLTDTTTIGYGGIIGHPT